MGCVSNGSVSYGVLVTMSILDSTSFIWFTTFNMTGDKITRECREKNGSTKQSPFKFEI